MLTEFDHALLKYKLLYVRKYINGVMEYVFDRFSAVLAV